jgi:enoyl-CoA hydratase
MIEAMRTGDVVVVKPVHGKATALDIELCEAIVTRFNTLRTTPDKAIVLTGQGRMFSAGVCRA